MIVFVGRCAGADALTAPRSWFRVPEAPDQAQVKRAKGELVVHSSVGLRAQASTRYALRSKKEKKKKKGEEESSNSIRRVRVWLGTEKHA